ncbi:hypothetical protein HOLleu_09289 [Holothuria leucospilota]|uniref:VWFC domain-containing protein n=1 Tax=Holothuria leucospilota TaxID=206669 RepID=A0A9Q1HE13_HOLLE|nr:hypothetical protein HOLleu_09289 [Holothuria leucospilota]
MKILYLFFTAISVISAVAGQDVSVCPGGHMPESCEDVPDSCESAVCAHFPEAACRVDPCNNCSHLFYDEKTETILKCNDEPLLCASCFLQNGNACGGPGGKVEIVQCDTDQICGVFEADFEISGFNISVFYRGCVASHVFEKGDPSCYEGEDVEKHLLAVFNGGEVKEGFGCVCTEDICNNNDLSNYPKSAEILSCVDDVGIWYNPGVFKADVECDVRFCDNTGEFRCIVEEPTYRCEFDEYSYEDGETFISGTGNCVCNNGSISCTEGDQPGLVCYTSDPLLDELSGIEICEEDSVCVVGQITQPNLFLLTTYARGCYKRELLEIETGCTESFEDVQEAFPEYHPNNFFSVCVCNTSFCNERQFLEPPIPGAKCSYNGELIDHDYEFKRDECNLCKCNHGEILCTRFACNGLQCYSCKEDTLDGTLDCGITICQDGELCANFHFQLFGFHAREDVEQGCVTEDEVLPLYECITDRDLIEKTHFVGEGFQTAFFYEGSLLICNENFCNSRQNFIETCFPDQVVQASTETPLKFCVSMDGTERYMPGDIEIFGCERCTCGGHLDIGMWECVEDLFLCPNKTPPPVKPTEDPSATYCTFGTGFPNYTLNEHFKSGCGDCICEKGVIRCTEGQCPGLVCASTRRSAPIFCEEGSFCLYQQRYYSSEIGPVSEVKRDCLPVSDWPYNTTMSDNITVFDPIATSGEAFVCSENLCNGIGYSEGFQQCEFNGVYYMHMDEFRPDECNLCVCVHGLMSCTSEPCNGPICSEHVVDLYSPFLDIPSRNVTCLFDENCVYAENVTFFGLSILGEASGCLKNTEAPDPGQCTNNISAIGLLFLDAPTSGILCTIDNSKTVQTSTATTLVASFDSTTVKISMVSVETTTQRPSRASKETTSMPSVSATTPSKFCSLDSEVGTTVTEGRCECTCKGGTNKQPKVSCKCSKYYDKRIMLLKYKRCINVKKCIKLHGR